MIYRSLERRKLTIGVYAVTLVASLDVAAWLSGFSIGWILSIVNVVIGSVLTTLSPDYRRPILFATLASLLLALSLRGHFFLAYYILQALLAITSLGVAVQVTRNWSRRKEPAFGSAGMVMVACLGGLALVIDPFEPFVASKTLALFTIGLSVILLVLSKNYRWHYLVVGVTSLLLFINLLSQTS
jgi:hypothetical protein